MSTALALQGAQLPAHLLATQQELLKESAKAAGGIKAGGFPSIGIKGSKFHIKKDGESSLVRDPASPDLPLMKLKVVVVGWNVNLTKTYFAGDYEQGSDREPDCRSDDGVFPDPDIAAPQSVTCATCPQNVWGSKVSKASGKDVKACSDNKKIVVINAEHLDTEALQLQISPAALKNWKEYVDLLQSKAIPIQSIITELTFDPQASYPKLQFGFGGFLSEDQFAKVLQRKDGEDVKIMTRPRSPQSITPRLPSPVSAPASTKLMSDSVTEQAPVRDTSEDTVAFKMPPADTMDARLAHLDASIRAVVVGSGGADSPVGIAILAQFPAPAPVAPVVVDPYANVPEALKAGIIGAVTASGGPDTPTGKLILATFQPTAQAPESVKKATRAKKAEPTPPVTVPASAAVGSTVPVTQTAPLSTAPAGNVVDSLAGNLEALLGSAMKVKG